MLKCTVALLCTILWFTGDRAIAQTSTAVISPDGYNASLGSTVIFNCNVNGTTTIVWRVDGESNNADQIQRGINTLTDIEEDDGTLTGRLEVSATENNSNIQIDCIAVSLSISPNGFSNKATLKVQGLLEPPSALEITNQGSFMQRLGWMVPNTLDLTDVDPDISYYNVCSTIMSEQLCRNVQDTEYVFLNVRMGIEFTVSAVNVVGEGDSSTATHTACDSTTATLGIDASEVSTEISLQSSGTIPIVSFSFEKPMSSGDSNCFNLYRIEASSSDQGTAFTQGPMMPSVSGDQGTTITLTVDDGLARDTIYNVTLVSVNINGEASSTGVKQFSTYDVQSIETSIRPGAIAVTCTFTTGSVVDNTVVQICQLSNDVVTENCQSLTIPRSPSSQISTQQLSSLQPGDYIITEVSMTTGNSVSMFSTEDLGHLELESAEVILPSTTTNTPSTGPTQPISPNPSAVNAGTIAGSVIGALVVVIVIVIVILLVYLLLSSRAQKRQNTKSEAVGLTSTEMWLEETDGGSAKRLTTSGDPPPPYLSPGDPNNGLSDMAVIQGRNGHHVEIDLTDSNLPDELQLDSVELTETVGTETKHVASPLYDTTLVDPSRPDILPHNKTRPTSGGPNLDRLTPDDIHEVKLAGSLDNLTKENTRSTDPLIGAHSVDSLNSKGQYAVIDHLVAKKSKKPKDSDLVLYSEIKVDELRPVVPQKKRKQGSSTGSLREEPRLETYHV